jgi:hypothetical protein
VCEDITAERAEQICSAAGLAVPTAHTRLSGAIVSSTGIPATAALPIMRSGPPLCAVLRDLPQESETSTADNFFCALNNFQETTVTFRARARCGVECFDVKSPDAPWANQVHVCLHDKDKTPLRRVWVQHGFTDYMTDADGCVTINAGGPLDIRVFAHNPVVQMVDGHDLTLPPVSQEIRGVLDGTTRTLPVQTKFWKIAEAFRQAYHKGLRKFRPWSNARFPSASARVPGLTDLANGRGVIRVAWPDNSVAKYSWTDDIAAKLGFFPLIHLKEGDEKGSTTIAHELGHALHFSRLPTQVRTVMQATYGAYLAVDKDRVHGFDCRTVDPVAWIEAFGVFAQEYAATGTRKDKDFCDRILSMRVKLEDGEDPKECGTNPESGKMFGSDVEGAIALTLFQAFANGRAVCPRGTPPGVGLPFVVESYLSCASLSFTEYAQCMAQRYGHEKYQALFDAAILNGITMTPPQSSGACPAGKTCGTPSGAQACKSHDECKTRLNSVDARCVLQGPQKGECTLI